MPAKVMILAQFEHGYYIRETLRRLTDVVAWLKAWWICVSVKQVTDQKSMPLLPRWGGKVEKPGKVVILAQFDHGYYIHGTLKRLMGVLAWLLAWWIRFDHGYYIRGTLKWLADVFARLKAWWNCVSVKQVTDRNLCPRCLAGEEMPTKVTILAQFGHGYYIHGTLKRLMGVLAWLRAWWILLGVNQVADQKSMPLLPRWRGNACESVLAWLKAWWICVSVKQVTDQKSMPLLPRWGGKVIEEMPTKVMILAQFEHGYYIRETLKRLTDVVDWLKARWIRVFWLASELGGSVEEMPAKVVILAQFEHGYYIRETLKRLTDVVAWLKAWWICVSVKQVTDQKSMPLLPRWGGKVVILAQFGHEYYIRGTSKCLTGFMD
ncbi:hypothetical protein C8R44DRAFT_731281 [Mycena epipterygia]|nr:hypothetical protein C8R44DRAFT_731281 [Mycena epipterygia]